MGQPKFEDWFRNSAKLGAKIWSQLYAHYIWEKQIPYEPKLCIMHSPVANYGGMRHRKIMESIK